MAYKKDGSQSAFLRLVKSMQPNVIIKALSGAAVLWHFLPDDHTNATTIHRIFCRESWSENGIIGRIQLLIGFLLWAPTMVVLIVYYTWHCGQRVKLETGKGIFRQMREQARLASRLAVPPTWYYMFELYKDPLRIRAREYIYRFETKTGLYHMLRDWLSSPESTMALSNKALFAERCEKYNVPVNPVLAKLIDGNIVRKDGTPGRLPAKSFFLKPIRGAGGRGASRWVYDGDTQAYYDVEGKAFNAEEMLDYVKRLGNSEDFVLRSLATNHPDMADLNLGALNTVRVLTCLDENGKGEVTHAVLRMASSADVVIDNFHAGGIAAKVDIKTGVLGCASNMGLTSDARWWDSHPVTGGQILGRTLPCWDELVDAACRAHAAFPDQVAIGWDIALVEDGPQLVEGNKGPDLDIIQRIYQEPIGNSRFGELLVFNLKRALLKKHGKTSQANA